MGVCVGVSVGGGVNVIVNVGMGVKVAGMGVKVSVEEMLVAVESGSIGGEAGDCPKVHEKVERINSVGRSRNIFFMSPLYSNPSAF
jgi:hypothetical protein